MDSLTRTPFQGLTNIIRFNWHFYVLSALLVVAGCLLRQLFFVPPLLVLAVLSIFLSLVVSWYIYDGSRLYGLSWLDAIIVSPGQRIVNIHAGFDETSALLHNKYPMANMLVFDFYDPAKHTEISIERARKAYAPYPGTIRMNTAEVPLEPASVAVIFLLFAAHEIRNEEERKHFFRQLQHNLQPGGKIIVLEHRRDIPNFIAYNIGFLHFFSTKTWKRTFASAQLSIEEEIKITPFLSAFILGKNGTAS
ncbi:MAG: methyltransferase [Chitinophaga sp.]|uniref:class I SAM-dependent methyltransferase n=1 Tax=Chitinophaga sp. TaxID=1869181 RepID=UPI001B0DA257|nr:class I SAM-dependent methyltransferase [Chitinophaga sp.]MBO9730769.1 methyltransferase [Chitinophaga sp.]